MSAIHRALLGLADDLSWFVRAREIRVLCIEVDDITRPPVLAQVQSSEGHADNASPFFLLEDAHTATDPGWSARTERMSAIHEARRRAMGETGHELGALPVVDHERAAPDVVFATRVGQCLAAQANVPELDGLVLVFAPTSIEDPARFAEAVAELLVAPPFAAVRAVLVDFGSETAELLGKRLGDAAMRTRCVVDKDTLRREQTETLAAAARAPEGASAQVQAGFAGPKDVVAPPRHGKALSPELSAKLARQLGPASALLGASGARLRKRILGAAEALQAGRFADATRLQAEACTQCLDAGLVQLGCVLETTLATYLLYGGDRTRARRVFEASAARAEAHGLFDVAAQALLGLAAVIVVDGDLAAGSLTYARAGRLAETSDMPMLAIEAYRCAGQIALRAGSEKSAIECWERALRVTSGAPQEVAASSSAPTVARALAKLAQDNGSVAAAQSLLDQADEYESRASREEIANAGE